MERQEKIQYISGIEKILEEALKRIRVLKRIEEDTNKPLSEVLSGQENSESGEELSNSQELSDFLSRI